MSAGLFIRGADLDGHAADVRVQEGRVVAVGADLTPEVGDEVVDAGRGALLPGLHDHHIHLLAIAAADRSLDVSTDLGAVLRAADASLPPGAWLRAVRYDDAVAGPLDRWALDALVPGRPVRVQHRSGALWVLSSPAVQEARLDEARHLPGVERDPSGATTGRVWRLDGWLRDRVPHEPVDLAAVGERLLRRGVTGVTDATPTEDASSIELLAAAAERGDLPQRVVVTGGPGLDDGAAAGLPRGPVKLLFPDHEPPDVEAVAAAVRIARTRGRAVAIHCVTRVAAVVTLAALEEVGPHPGDRIEHGAVLPIDVATRLAALGVTVVTNPGFVVARGDGYLAEVDPVDVPDLWRCRSLVDAGLAVAAGTDAPFGDADPWAAMAAAVDRRTATGRVLGAAEALPPIAALRLFLSPLDRPGGPPRSVAVGAPADLCLLTEPLAEVLGDLGAASVAATVYGGAIRRW